MAVPWRNMIEEADRLQLEEISFVLADRTKPTVVCMAVGSYQKRDELRRELSSRLPQYKSATLDLSGIHITSLFTAIKERAPQEVLNSRPVEYLLHIFGIEDSLFVAKDGGIADSSLIAELNLERENLFHEFPCCLILWTTPHFVEKLRKEAPDLFDWITYSYHFADQNCAPLAEDPRPLGSPIGVTQERKQRILEMEEKLERLQLDSDAPERVLRSKLALYKTLGAEYLGVFRNDDSIRCYTAALSLIRQVPHRANEEAELHFFLGDAHLQARHFDLALSHYQKSLIIEENDADSIHVGTLYHQIGIIYHEQRDWDEALENYRVALGWEQKTGQQHEMGSTWHQIGRVYQAQRNWANALESYRNALDWQERTGRQHEMGGTYHQIGIVYQEQGDLAHALGSYLKALEWKKKTDQQHEMGSTWHQIGLVYQGRRDWAKALESYRKALEWKEKTGQQHEMGSTRHQIGLVYQEQRDWAKALESYRNALELDEKAGQFHELGGTWHQIGRVYEEQVKYDEALDNYLTAVGLCRKTGMERHLEIALGSIARIFPKLSDEQKNEIKKVLPDDMYDELKKDAT